jgi:four helix bundle protein
MSADRPRFHFTRLDVYQVATAFVVGVDAVADSIPRGRSYLVDQLRRAALSIQANIAEGAGEFSPTDKARFYRKGLRSATECVALLDSAARLEELRDQQALEEARILLDRVIAMTTRLVRKFGGGGG